MRLGYRDLVIALFAIGIILGLAFGTGTIYGRSSAPTPTPSIGGGGAGAGGGAALAGGAPGGGNGAGGANGGGGGGGPFAGQTVGTVVSVLGSTFTVREPSGSMTTLAEDPSRTTYTATAPGNASSLQSGQFVVVSPGPPNAQGQTIAESILILPASFAGGGAAASGGAGGARPSATPAR